MLDWEENLFIGLRAAYRRLVVRPRDRRREQVVTRLRDRRQTLLLVAEMIAGRSLAVFETEDRLLFQDDRLFLPPEIAEAGTRDANEGFYVFKTLLAALALRDAWPGLPATPDAFLLRYQDEFPALPALWNLVAGALPAEPPAWSRMGTLPPTCRRPGASSLPPASPPRNPEAVPVTTEIEGRGSAAVDVLPGRDDDGPGADMPMHTFEKVETVEEYSGLSRKTDDADELHEHAEGLRELRMTQVVRTSERPRSIYRGDLILDGVALEVDDPAKGGIPYPEWDHRRGQYRSDWCHVRVELETNTTRDWVDRTSVRHARLIRQLRCQFASLTSAWLRRRRQFYGDEFDLDAIVDSEVERRAGYSPSEAIYVDQRRDVHDIAALILLDESYSTDAWIEDRRVLDIIRESVFCVGEVLESDVASFAVATFSSNTRRSCRFKMIKGFREPWTAARARLGALEPVGYTRIGPALRHAQELLAREPSRRRTVILLTDGRPCDYDRYEGHYGIQDVKKAIEVGRLHGLHTHAFAVEKQAAEYFPRMFTKHDFDILPHPDRLARTMCRLFARLLER